MCVGLQLMSCEQTDSLCSMAEFLPTAVSHAAGLAGVTPISGPERLIAEAKDAVELQNMLEAELTQSLSRRLERDDDYIAER